MSDLLNPFESPETLAVPVKSPVAQGSLTETMLIHLKEASPWLRFVGILGFIGSGFTVLTGVSLFSLSSQLGELWYQVPGVDQIGYSFRAVLTGVIWMLCIGGAVLLFFPSLFIYRFGEKIRSYIRTGTEQDLESAFRNNRSFWKFIGILFIVELAFIPLLIIVGIILAVVTVFP